MSDCSHGEDEAHCISVVGCTSDQFKCRNSGSCISGDKFCDGINDCPDYTDELYCGNNATFAPGLFSFTINLLIYD